MLNYDTLLFIPALYSICNTSCVTAHARSLGLYLDIGVTWLSFPFFALLILLSVLTTKVEPDSSVGSVADVRTVGRWFDPRLVLYSFRGLMIVVAKDLFFSHRRPLFQQRLCGKATSGVEIILCGVLVWKKNSKKAWIGELAATI